MGPSIHSVLAVYGKPHPTFHSISLQWLLCNFCAFLLHCLSFSHTQLRHPSWSPVLTLRHADLKVVFRYCRQMRSACTSTAYLSLSMQAVHANASFSNGR